MSNYRFGDRFMKLWEDTSFVHSQWRKFQEKTVPVLSTLIERQGEILADRRTFDEVTAELGPQIDELPNDEVSPELIAEYLNHLTWHIMLRTQYKVLDALSLFFDSANSFNTYGVALASRSIIEHVGVLQVLYEKLPWKEATEQPRTLFVEQGYKTMKTIMRLMNASEFDWERYLGEERRGRATLLNGQWSRKPDGTEHDVSGRTPSSQFIAALEKELVRIYGPFADNSLRSAWAMLSDIIHPNWGGAFLYSDNMYDIPVRPLAWQERVRFHRRTLAHIHMPVHGSVQHLTEITSALHDVTLTHFGVRRRAES